LTRVKVCGIMDEQDLDSAILGGADAVGFIVDIEGSRHRISAGIAKELVKKVPVFTKSVAVIAPANIEDAVFLANETEADILQVHGTLGFEEIAKLKDIVSQKIIAASAPGQEALDLAKVADAVLLDTVKDGKLGGTGAVHDWFISSKLAEKMKAPVILAGGLNPSNIGKAIKVVRPYAVDVSSGVETNGRKDQNKIESFIKEVLACKL
jgi:phosphoribosylanthranilate isomerase